MWRKFQEYFNFSKRELNGILMLCLLTAFVLVLPSVINKFSKPDIYKFDDFDQEMKQFLASAKRTDLHKSYKTREKIEERELHPSYFYFDPNSLPDNGWRKLGLSAGQIRVIKNFESKGGRFYQKQDLKKIYSLSKEEYDLLEPYIRIKEQRTSNKNRNYLADHTSRKDFVTHSGPGECC
jgi:competence protein ComEA